VAVSPTGAHIAYAANQRVYLRATNQPDSTVVAESDRGGPTSHGRGPFFSADGEWLAYWQGGALKKVSVHGGAPVVICQAINPLGATWTAANTILFGGDRTGIWRVPAAGGVPEVVITLKLGESAHGPQLLPDGKSILFTLKPGNSWDEARIVVQTPGSDDRTVVVPGARDGRYVAGHLIYAQRGTLFGVAFDAPARTVRGPAVALVENVGDAGNNSGAADFSTSDAGLLVYGSASGTVRPPSVAVWVDRQGHEQQISSLPERRYMYPRLSPDGRKVAVTIQDPRSDIWVYDLQRGTSTRLTFDGDNERSVWRPDGQRLAIASSRDGATTNLYSIAADGSGSPERLTTSAFQQVPEAWAQSGDVIAFSENRPETTGWDVWSLSLTDRKPAPFLQTRFHDGGRLFSPDGHWLVYYSDESGRGEVQVRSFPSGEGKWQISSDGGAEPVWSRNGRELFYRNGTKLMVVDVALQPTFHASAPRLVFDAAYVTTNPANFDVSPDGQRFLMLKEVAPAMRETARLMVLQNWFGELERLRPAK
jgi:Tol biopolymer transport system component